MITLCHDLCADQKIKFTAGHFLHQFFSGGAVIGLQPATECADGGEQQGAGGQDPFGATALEAQFGGHLMPPGPDFAEYGVIAERDVGEGHLVEVVCAVHRQDRADGHPWRVGRHDELAEPGVAMGRIQRAGAGQHDELMGQVSAAGPHLGPVEHPPIGALGGSGRHGGQIGARAVLAHPDGRVQPALRDAGQQSAALLLGAVRHQPWGDLAVGDPVCRDGGAAGEQLLGHHVAV